MSGESSRGVGAGAWAIGADVRTVVRSSGRSVAGGRGAVAT